MKTTLETKDEERLLISNRFSTTNCRHKPQMAVDKFLLLSGRNSRTTSQKLGQIKGEESSKTQATTWESEEEEEGGEIRARSNNAGVSRDEL